ncbi:protein SCO1/2 [Thermonema lapsum]|uniref:Protein SCO1/2 n=1 Tax=Thermonema lapsum TaxID=28195 RepID=A0A846MNG8_9BACT|nr:SCO family protein [Thermonema lapsum]NIK73044.1 protein SCO1/2 [Thermonema lapsum]
MYRQLNLYLFIWALVVVFYACKQEERRLPYLGEKQVVSRTTADGQTIVDTVYHRIPPFRFINQEGDTITEKNFEGKVYVADFFFTTCPTICPKMSAEMLKVYEHFQNDDRVLFLSHSIDTKYDSVPVLKAYAEKLGVTAPKWHFVTGNRKDIYAIAEHYMVTASEDPAAPGGYVHSGALLLIDGQRHIRGVYNGTDPQDTKKLIEDIELLLKETASTHDEK